MSFQAAEVHSPDFTHTGPYNVETGEYVPLPDDEYESKTTLGNPSSIIYEDEHVLIDSAAQKLTIKHYILIHPTLHIQISDILYICPATEFTTRIGLRPWGMGLTGILWARDFKRGGAIVGPKSGYEKSFIVKVKGDRMKSGFSVVDVKAFTTAMETVCAGVMSRKPEAQERDKKDD
jgi:hypothetical protein